MLVLLRRTSFSITFSWGTLLWTGLVVFLVVFLIFLTNTLSVTFFWGLFVVVLMILLTRAGFEPQTHCPEYMKQMTYQCATMLLWQAGKFRPRREQYNSATTYSPPPGQMTVVTFHFPFLTRQEKIAPKRIIFPVWGFIGSLELGKEKISNYPHHRANQSSFSNSQLCGCVCF